MTGWALDPDKAAQPATVNFYVDGAPGSGTFIGTTTANAMRPDVNRATGFAGDHGFSWVAPARSDDRVHRLYAYAADSSGRSVSNLAGSPILLYVTENTILGTFNVAPGAMPGAKSIAGSFKDSPIIITTASAFAGSIFSLTWNGKQFINSYDHGRELQSAAFFDGYVECFNPTEAGSSDDFQNSVSTSHMLSVSTVGNALRTRTQMAFWLKPGEKSVFCGSAPTAVNTTALSSHILEKTVTLDFQGIPNVIEHKVTFHVAEQHSSAVFEALTGYMPQSFSKFWTYNPLTRTLVPLSGDKGEQGFPVILATADRSYAMGVYSPDEPQMPRVGYGYYRFDSSNPADATTKWNCFFQETNVTVRDYTYRCYSIIGTLNDVRDALNNLYSYFGAGAHLPPDTPPVRH